MSLQLYELVGTDAARPFSPYCWRTRMALAHKGLDCGSIPWRFTEKDAIAPYGSERVPVLLHDDKPIADSWAIANYLEDRFSERPSLFGGEGGRAAARLINAWGDIAVVGGLFPLIVADIPAHLGPADRDYFRASREARRGRQREEAAAGRDTAVLAFRRSLEPLRITLRAAFSRRRRGELCRLHCVRRLPVGARRQPVQIAGRERSDPRLAREIARCLWRPRA